MAYVGLPAFVNGFDHREVERLLNRSRFNSFLTALFSAAVVVLCIASFIFEWWTLTTTPSVVRFYVTGKINICDGSGANCAPGSLAQVSGSNNSSTGMTATRILALVMTSINLLNGIFAVLFASGHSSYLSRIVDAVPTLGATALQTPPGMFLERYHKQRRGPASLVTGGLIAAILALAPFGAITAQWINNITGINNDPAFDSRPGSGYFTVIVTIVAWLLVAFNIRRADYHYLCARNISNIAAGGIPVGAVVIAAMPAGGYVPAGVEYAPAAVGGYAPYAPQQQMAAPGYY